MSSNFTRDYAGDHRNIVLSSNPYLCVSLFRRVSGPVSDAAPPRPSRTA